MYVCICQKYIVYCNVRLFVYRNNNLAKDSFFFICDAAAAVVVVGFINQAKITRLKNITPYILML